MDTRGMIAASDLLLGAWRSGAVIEALPAGLQPKTRGEAYAVQARVELLSKAPLRGWKIAATSKAGQAHIGVDGPLAGRLIDSMVHADGATLPFGDNRMRVAEAEFVFRMGQDLPPRPEPYTQAEVMAAVAALHLGIEVPDSRYIDFVRVGALQLIADNACAHAFVLGPQAPAHWRDLDLSRHRVTGKVSDRLVREGIGANVLGDPRIALTWLANELSSHGMTLAAGQFVTTGTCMVPLEIEPGDTVTVDFGSLGTVSLHFHTS